MKSGQGTSTQGICICSQIRVLFRVHVQSGQGTNLGICVVKAGQHTRYMYSLVRVLLRAYV